MKPSTGYETLIYDVLIGDPTLFNRADNIEAGMDGRAAVARRLGEGRGPEVHTYAAGTERAERRRTTCWPATAA